MIMSTSMILSDQVLNSKPGLIKHGPSYLSYPTSKQRISHFQIARKLYVGPFCDKNHKVSKSVFLKKFNQICTFFNCHNVEKVTMLNIELTFGPWLFIWALLGEGRSTVIGGLFDSKCRHERQVVTTIPQNNNGRKIVLQKKFPENVSPFI